MRDSRELLDFLTQRQYYTEVVRGRPAWLTPLVQFNILGFKPLYSFLVRVPPLRRLLLDVDWKVGERIVEYPWLYRCLGRGEGIHRVLDVGCADSRVSMELASMGFSVTGLDRRGYPLSHPNFRFVRADISGLPFRDGSFDLVVCISTIEHVGVPSYGIRGFADGDRRAVEEIRRCLRSGGLLYLSVPFGKGGLTWQRIYDREALRGLLGGFEVLESRYYRRWERKFWREVRAEGLEGVASPSEEGANGVAIQLCRKQ